MSYYLQIKNEIYVHDRKLFTIVSNLKVGKGKSSITKKKKKKTKMALKWHYICPTLTDN